MTRENSGGLLLVAVLSFGLGYYVWDAKQASDARVAQSQAEIERLYREFPLQPGKGPALPCERPDCSNAPAAPRQGALAPRWNTDPYPEFSGPMSYVMLLGQERIEVPSDVLRQLRLQEAQSVSESQLAEIRAAMRGI